MHEALHTPICDRLGIEYPIFLAGMGGVSMSKLVAAVSNAGGLAVMGAATLSAPELRDEIKKTRELRSSELWSWRYVDGRYEPVPFGQSSGDVDESNAAQLWSTVYLASHPFSLARVNR